MNNHNKSESDQDAINNFQSLSLGVDLTSTENKAAPSYKSFPPLSLQLVNSNKNSPELLSDTSDIDTLEDILDIRQSPKKPRTPSSNGKKPIPAESLNNTKQVHFDFDLDEDHENLHIHSATPNTRNLQHFDMTSLPVVAKHIETEYSMSSFSNIKYLCDGSHSNIYKANIISDSPLGELNPDYVTVIIKVLLDKSVLNPVAIDEFEKETTALSKICHPNVIDIYGSGFIESKKFLGRLRPMIVVEALDGATLTYHLSIKRSFHSRPFTESRYLRMAKEFASALKYIHDEISPECTLIHRDLKPDNIGFTKDGTLKLLDFGLAVCARKNVNNEDTYKLTGCTGSLRYMAPEVALSQPYNEKIDIYGFGVIMYQIITGVAPYLSFKKEDFYAKVVNDKFRPPLTYDDFGREIHMDKELQELIKSCWDDDHTKRPSAAIVFATIQTIETEHEKNSKRSLSRSFRRSYENLADAVTSYFVKRSSI